MLLTAWFALGSRGGQRFLRPLSLLGALALRDFYVAVRSWEPWRSMLITSFFALGSLGGKKMLRRRSLLGALAVRDCYVAARSGEPWR